MTGPDPATTQPTRVVVVDDQAIVRAGLRRVLDAEPTIEVVGEAADGLAAMQVIAETRPDVVLMDLDMPKLDGIDATSLVTRPSGGTAPSVLVLTTVDLDDQVFAALRVGASGFLMKSTASSDLITAIHVAASGRSLPSPAATRRLIEHFAERTSAPVAVNDALTELSNRERQVFDLVGGGASDAAIASRLEMDEDAAGDEVARVLAKLRLVGRVQAFLFAYEAGLVSAAARGRGPLG